jgi:sugar lactone lactonase YvrE
MGPIAPTNVAGAASTAPSLNQVWYAHGSPIKGAIDTSTGLKVLYFSGGFVGINGLAIVAGPAYTSNSYTAWNDLLAKAPSDAGANLGVLLTTNLPPIAPGSPIYVAGMAFDPDVPMPGSGFMYLADAYGQIIKTTKDLKGGVMIAFTGIGGDGGTFNGPSDVAYGPDGKLYIADQGNDRIVRVDDIYGTGWTTLTNSAGSGQGQFRLPNAVTASSDGGIFVADTANHRIIQLADPSGAGWTAYAPGTTGAHKLIAPVRIRVVGGVIYVLDQGDATTLPRVVTMTDLSGANYAAYPFSSLKQPQGLEVNPVTGAVYLADTGNNQVLAVDDLANTTVTTLGLVDGGTATGTFRGPTDLAITPDGGLLVLDTGNNRVVRFDTPATASALATPANWTTYSPGSAQGFFNQPTGLAFGSDGRIYVSDTRNHRLVRLDDLQGGGFAAMGVDGSGNGQFVHPAGIFVK